jgi:nucleoside-diphosphate-sugar epimerase
VAKKWPIPAVILSNKLARKYLGYQPAVSLKEGLGLTFSWQRDKYKNLGR